MKEIKEKAMSNETDLDWLARNVHAWPSKNLAKATVQGVHFTPYQDGEDEFTCDWPYKYGLYTESQWLARRAELQNKPSWKGAPKWAEWLAQDEHGDWWWHKEAPETRISEFDSAGAMESNIGEVLGDWRDTLEKRPEEFQPFTSIEDNQEKAMKQDNGWHERGELPPVGVECDIRHSCWNSEKYEKVAVAAITNEYLIVKYATFEQHYMLKDISFRPIRTEREVLIEIIKNTDDTYDRIADAILTAGFSLGG